MINTEPEVLLGVLSAVAERLEAEPGFPAVCEAALPAIGEALGAEVSVLALRSGEHTLRLVASVGVAESVQASWTEFDTAAAVPLAAAVRNAEPVWVPDVAAAREQFPALPASASPSSLCAMPIRHENTVIGVLGLAWSAPREFHAAEQQMLATATALLAAVCAKHPEPSRDRLRPHDHPAPAGVHVACLCRVGGARCTVQQHRTGSRPGPSSVFATLLDADPQLGPRTLDTVSGVLALCRRQQVPPALVADAVKQLAEDVDGPVTGAHIEIAPDSGWIAVAPLDSAGGSDLPALIVSTPGGGGDGGGAAASAQPADSGLARERILFANGDQPAAVIALVLAPRTGPGTAETVRQLALSVVTKSSRPDAVALLGLLADELHRSEMDPIVRGAVAVVLDARPHYGERSRVLPARPVSAVLGRRFAVAALSDEADGETADRAELVVDELVSNAVRHADETVDVTVSDEPTGTRVAVTDDDDRAPVRAVSELDSEHGRGSGIVASLADEVGVTRRAAGGKAVWARLRWRTSPSRSGQGDPDATYFMAGRIEIPGRPDDGIRHAVDGDGSPVCQELPEGAGFIPTDVRWQDETPRHRCQQCQVLVP